MDGRPELDRFLRTDPRDVGCAQAMDMLHIYAVLAAAGGPAERRYPGITAHLRACGPCGDDFDGLLAALTATRWLPHTLTGHDDHDDANSSQGGAAHGGPSSMHGGNR
jgi:hypothetical protein